MSGDVDADLSLKEHEDPDLWFKKKVQKDLLAKSEINCTKDEAKK